MDQIVIKNLRVFAYHGVNPEEKRDGQPFIFTIKLKTEAVQPAAKNDSLADTVNYSKVVKCVIAAATSQSYDLIETLAEEVAQSVLRQFAAVRSLSVQVKKPQAPVKADFDYVGVKIKRSRRPEGEGNVHAANQ